MKKPDSLFLLVASLTKSEKRYFQMYANLQDGDKDYVCLFDIMEKAKTSPEAKLIFTRQRPGASYSASGKYLYKIITDCLMHMRIDQDKSARLLTSLLKTNILFEKSLYDQAFRSLKKIQSAATLHEEHFIRLWAAKLEVHQLANTNYEDCSENQLINKQHAIQEILKQEKLVNEHSALYALLRHRVLYKGDVRTRKQKDELNDLVMAELSITRNPLAETFQSAKMHLLFQAQYFITVNDYKSALKVYHELNKLFEDNEYIWIESPNDYIASLEGILDSLNSMKKFTQMDFFLSKLLVFSKRSQYLDIRIQSILFIYNTITLLDAGEFEKANSLIKKSESTIFTKLFLLDLHKQAQVYMYAALIQIGRDDIKEAYNFLNKLLMAGNTFADLPVFRTFRLLNLLVHYELGNHDYIDSEIRSIRRALVGSPSRSYLVEKLIFSFLQKRLPPGLTERKKLWLGLEGKFSDMEKEQFEIQILKIFDFGLWVKAKLLKKTFAGLVKQKVRGSFTSE